MCPGDVLHAVGVTDDRGLPSMLSPLVRPAAIAALNMLASPTRDDTR